MNTKIIILTLLVAIISFILGFILGIIATILFFKKKIEKNMSVNLDSMRKLCEKTGRKPNDATILRALNSLKKFPQF